MPRTYRAYIPEQSLLMPPSLSDWLAEDHLSYFISDAVDAMDLSGFEQRHGTDGPGNQAFDPRMMVKVMIYGYGTGVFSSRKIAAKLREDVAFRMLGAENFPAHRTISDFRKLHLEEFGKLFVQVVMMAREAGLVKMGTVAVDGTKMRANASKRKAMSYQRMKKQETELGEQIRDLLNRATATDEDEDQRYGKDRRGDELPDGLATRKKRLATIQAAMKRLEERQMAARIRRERCRRNLRCCPPKTRCRPQPGVRCSGSTDTAPRDRCDGSDRWCRSATRAPVPEHPVQCQSSASSSFSGRRSSGRTRR